MMTEKIHLTHLFSLLALLTGVCPRTLEEIYVKAGDMVALQCPHYTEYNHGNAKLTWTSYTPQEMDLTNMSSAEQRQTGVLVHERSFVILRASINHQGNYSCSLGAGSQFWFRLTVYTTLSREYEDRTQYDEVCYTQESCKLNCPADNFHAVNTLNITRNNIIWHKEGESLREDGYYFNEKKKERDYYFLSVEEKDHGVYTCTRSYLYLDQIYNRSFTVVLNVQPKKDQKYAVIQSPRKNAVFDVDLGSTVVIDCKAELFSDFDDVFWLIGNSLVEGNDSSSVFYNSTWDKESKEMTASLVFKNMSEQDLSRNYTCKLESASQPPINVTITLVQKARTYSLSLAFGIVGIVVAIAVVVVYVKQKSDSAPFQRDTLDCYRSTSGWNQDLVHYQKPQDILVRLDTVS